MGFLLAALATPTVRLSFSFVLNFILAQLAHNCILFFLTGSVDPSDQTTLMYVLKTARTFTRLNQDPLVIRLEANSALFEIR